jgi:DHA1 family tetracycline resistance protein-like MFS transporter
MAPKASLFVIFLTVFIDLLGFGIVLPLLPVYGKDFAQQMGVAEGSTSVGLVIGLLMSCFSIMQFLFAPLWGRLSDRIGRRPVLIVGLAGSVVFYALFGVATVYKSLALLFVARIGAGLAGATISTAHAYIADATTVENRAKGMALVGAAFGLGFTFGPLFGYFALPSGQGDPGPGPGYAASALSLVALLLAIFKLPESLKPGASTSHKKWFDWNSLRDALATPSIGALLLSSFLCVTAFANFESTLSLLMKDEQGAFHYSFQDVCLTFAFIGLVLTIVQGGVVRRVSGKVAESKLALFGAIVEIGGLLLLAMAAQYQSSMLLYLSLAVVVSGFAFFTPSINSLISRRSDPEKQGGILGVGQSVSSLARIVGPLVGLPLFHVHPSFPLWLATGLMVIGALLVFIAGRSGRDYSAPATS